MKNILIINAKMYFSFFVFAFSCSIVFSVAVLLKYTILCRLKLNRWMMIGIAKANNHQSIFG